MEKKMILRLTCAAIIIHAVLGEELKLDGKLKECTETAYHLITIDWYNVWGGIDADKAKIFGKSKLIHADKVIVISGFSTKTSGKISTPIVQIHNLVSDLKSITELITGFDTLILCGVFAAERLKLLAQLKWVGVVNMERLNISAVGKLEDFLLSDGPPKQFIVSKSGFELIIIKTEILKKMLQKKSHRLVVADRKEDGQENGQEDGQEVLSFSLGNQNTIDVMYADTALALKLLPVILSAERILAAKFEHIGGEIPKDFKDNVSSALFQLQQPTLKCRVVNVNKKLCVYRF